jgi:hypothetical protein
LEKQKAALNKDRRDLTLKNVADSQVYDRKKAAIQAIQDNLNDAEESFIKIDGRMLAIKNQFLDMYSRFGKMEGARAAFNFDSHWDENIEKLKSDNPGFSFSRIHTENARLYMGLKSGAALPENVTVLGYELPGTMNGNAMELNSSFPPKISTNVILSLVGACALLHPADFDIDPEEISSGMSYGLTVTYDFPTAMMLSVKAKYNMHKMYQKYVSSGSSGGLFSSHSWTSVEEHNFFSDSFVIDWTEQDPQNSISDEDRLKVESDMRRGVLERYANMALPSIPNRDAILQATTPPAHGAVVIANSLTSACPGNPFCVAGSAIFSVLDAIFGSSSQSANSVFTQDVDQVEKWEKSKIVLKPWITTYSPTKIKSN